jgi:hypothetical protein
MLANVYACVKAFINLLMKNNLTSLVAIREIRKNS